MQLKKKKPREEWVKLSTTSAESKHKIEMVICKPPQLIT